MIVVSLTKDEVRNCTDLAVNRWLMKFGSEDRPNYAQGKKDGKLESELIANIRTIVAEWAVAVVSNLSWSVPFYPNSMHAKRKDIADVGQNVEVRTVRTQDGVPVWKKDAGKFIAGARVIDDEYFTQVEVWGWVKADDVIGNDVYWDEYIRGWRFPLDRMAPFPEL
jgi:hypothetical protein